MATFESVAQQALSLPLPDRLRLASELLESVEPQARVEIEQAWEEEIDRRISQIDSGEGKGRAWDDVKRDFDARYGR